MIKMIKMCFVCYFQDKMISRKRKEKPRPMRGSFLANREENKSSRISLFKLANGCAPTLRNEQEVCVFVYESIILKNNQYKFDFITICDNL